MTDFSFLLDRIKAQTPEETRESLKRAGILDENGQLAEKYRPKSDKTIVDIEEIKEALDVIAEFDKLNLNEVELHENGEPIQIPEGYLEEFKFCGLCNRNFIEMEWWKIPPEEFEWKEVGSVA